MKFVRGEAQLMCQERSWAGEGVLVSTSRELDGNTTFKRLAGELTADLDVRSLEDQALVVLLPAVLPAVRAYYEGQGLALVELLAVDQLRILDTWLCAEIRRWADRWLATDPTQSGCAPSTAAALDEIRGELRSSARPPNVTEMMTHLALGTRPEIPRYPCRTGLLAYAQRCRSWVLRLAAGRSKEH